MTEKESNWEMKSVSNEEELQDFLDRLIEEVEQFDEKTELEEVYAHVGFANHVLQRSSDVLFTEYSTSVSANSLDPQSAAQFSQPSSISLPWKSQGLKNRLQNWIQKLRQKVQNIAQNKGADSYSITVGTPLSVSVSVTFDI